MPHLEGPRHWRQFHHAPIGWLYLGTAGDISGKSGVDQSQGMGTQRPSTRNVNPEIVLAKLARAIGSAFLVKAVRELPGKSQIFALGPEARSPVSQVLGSPLFHFYNREEALRVIAERVKKAKVVLNTAITEDSLPPIKLSPAMRLCFEAARGAIRTCSVFKDVIIKAWLKQARRRLKEMENAKREKAQCGVYDYRCVPGPIGGFLNFTLFEYRDGSKECFCGWLMSRRHGFEQPSISTT